MMNKAQDEFKLPYKMVNKAQDEFKLPYKIHEQFVKQFAEQIASDREYLELNLISQGINPHAVQIATHIWYDDEKEVLNFKHVVISKTPENPL